MILDPSSIFFWLLIVAVIAGAVVIISRPFSTYVKFVYPNAKFEAMGNLYVEDKGLISIIDSRNLSDFKEHLNALKDYKVEGETSNELQESLDKSFLTIVEMMKKDSSKKMNEFYNAYLEKIDIYLVKNVLKNKLLEKTSDETIISRAILPSTKELLQNIINAEKEDLQSILKTYGFSEEIVDSISDKDTNFLLLDSSIDKYVINKFKTVKVPYKCEQAKQKFVKTMIDIQNIKNVLRAKQFGYDEPSCMKLFLGDGGEIASWKYKEITEVNSVSQVISSLEGTSYYNELKDAIEQYNKEQSVQVLENALDINFLKQIKDISTQNYVTIGPTIRFLISKEFEIKNLKIIAKGIDEHLSPELIKCFLIKEAT
jgi:V/A-type H+-transporting ATPase subunit C